jgi:hypothetical protein
VRSLHSLVMKRSRPDIAGKHADLPRYVRTETGRHAFPSPAEIPALMGGMARHCAGDASLPAGGYSPIQRWQRTQREASDERAGCCSPGGSAGLYSRFARGAGRARDGEFSQSSLQATGCDFGRVPNRVTGSLTDLFCALACYRFHGIVPGSPAHLAEVLDVVLRHWWNCKVMSQESHYVHDEQ